MRFQKKHAVLYGAALLSLLVSVTLAGVSDSLAGRLDSQCAAERWQGDGETPYAQVSVFLGQGAGFTTDSADYVAEAVDAALKQAAMEQEKDGPRLWYDAYSVQAGQVQMNGKKRTAATAEVTAVGGDFFLMHPLELLDGSYFTEDDLMQDRVVLDEKLAWDLFGSAKVSGMEVLIDDTKYLIAGVVKPEKDSASKTAYGDKPHVYISYSLYQTWQSENTSAWIGCYEVVMPNLVRGYAEKTVTDAIGERSCTQILQNTGRTSLSHRWHTLRHLHDMVIVPDSLSYPYWENAARIYDYDMGVLLGFQIAFLVLPLIVVLRLLWKAYRWTEQLIARKRQERKDRFRTTLDIQV